MTHTVWLEHGGDVRVQESQESPGLVFMRLSQPSLGLSPRDIGRLIAALSRTQAARRDRRATPVGPREA